MVKMSNMRTLTEMMSIPTGNRPVNASGLSGVTDSQFFFGSQFWPENSQAASQSMSLSSWNSTQSQEESDSTLLRTYQSKPLLFGENKDKSKFISLLDKFEEDKKKKKKENSDSENLTNECIHIRETLNKIHQVASGTEKNSAVCYTALEKIEHFVSGLKDDLKSLQSDILVQLQTLLNEVNAQKENVTGLKGTVEKTNTDLGSSVLSLLANVDGLKKDHQTERDMLEEALKLLSSLVSRDSPKRPVMVMDSFIQTSPSLTQSLPGSLHENPPESIQPGSACKADATKEKERRVSVGKRKLKRLSVRRKKRPLMMAQNSKPVVLQENCNKAPLSECRKSFITPLSCWSQDSNSSACLTGIDPILDSAEASASPGGLWQLFELEF